MSGPLFFPRPDAQVLRPYQAKIRDAVLACIQRRVRPLVELPTAAGKTTIAMSALAISIEAGLKAAWLTHRRELIAQASERATGYGLQHGIIAPDSDVQHGVPFHIASIDTLRARLARTDATRQWLANLDVVVVDEAHHLAADSWQAIAQAAGNAVTVGLTASPYRLDGRPLGDFFNEAIRGPSPAALEALGFIAPVRVIAPPSKVDLTKIKKRMGDFVTSQVEAEVNTDEVNQAAVMAYALHCGGEPAIAYCVTVRHAEDAAAAFTAAGWSVEVIEGRISKGDRDNAIRGLASGRYQILFSVDCISEGTDIPVVSAAIMLRPTASTGLCLQQTGRIRRLYPGKTEAILLDLVGNWTRHGMPNAERPWSLTEGVKGLERAVKAARLCAGCRLVTERGPERCPNCNRRYRLHVIRPNAPDESQLAGMRGLGAFDAMALYDMPMKEALKVARTSADLSHLATIRGYDKRWIANVLRARGQYQMQRRSA